MNVVTADRLVSIFKKTVFGWFLLDCIFTCCVRIQGNFRKKKNHTSESFQDRSIESDVPGVILVTFPSVASRFPSVAFLLTACVLGTCSQRETENGHSICIQTEECHDHRIASPHKRNSQMGRESVGVLISYRCCKKLPEAKWLKTTEIYSPHCCRFQKSESKLSTRPRPL